MAHACSRAVVVLAEGSDSHSVRLGALGVCASVVESLHLFPSSAPIAKWGCRAVAVLADGGDANVSRLGSAGCCEVVPVVMQVWIRFARLLDLHNLCVFFLDSNPFFV